MKIRVVDRMTAREALDMIEGVVASLSSSGAQETRLTFPEVENCALVCLGLQFGAEAIRARGYALAFVALNDADPAKAPLIVTFTRIAPEA